VKPAGLLPELPTGLRTRFAPSPTGYLHLGHVVNLLYVWGAARACGGTVILRMEDHDRGRSRMEYERAILEDLEWLGFVPDEGLPLDDFKRPSSYRQSDCGAYYAEMLDRLRRAGLIYACRCSRAEIRSAGGEEMDGLYYPGICRDLNLPDAGHTLRVRIGPEPVEFNEVLTGKGVQCPFQQCGDFAVRDRQGQWTYQFACVCDDLRQNIRLVVRGKDLFESTGRQVLLRRMLGGGEPPLFLHHPLLHGPEGLKLSKRLLSESITRRRLAGEPPETVLGEAAFRCGWIARNEPVSLDLLLTLFRHPV